MMARLAFSRLSQRPRSTSATSRRCLILDFGFWILDCYQIQHEVVNGLCVFQRLVEFLARRHELARETRVTKRGHVRGENFSRGDKSSELRQNADRLPDESADVVGPLKHNAVGSKPAFYGFFRCLLAVIDCSVERAVRRAGRDARRL